jgi:exopolysaccharide/PEP-CTERM locus tyrosine autokinase
LVAGEYYVSFVEKALKKLQESQATGAKAGNKTGDPVRDRSPVVVGVMVKDAVVGRAESDLRRSSKSIRVDRSALRSLGLIPPEKQERRLANEFRHIKRPLIAAALGKGVEPLLNGHLIMVASALPGDGKTFTSMNLALSMALEKDISVLLVDADVAKPHISTTFGVASEPGLVDALANSQLDIETLVIPTDVPGLSILPAGRANESATELLASERMVHIVKALAQTDARRIVVFDSPPLLLTSESRALADVVGQIVLVVRAGATAKSAVTDALALLGEDRPVGIVLNQAVLGSTESYYGYNYGYGSNTDNE